MDGTADLYSGLMKNLSGSWRVTSQMYPRDVKTSYSQLLQMLQFQTAEDAPFLLVAESYSTPLAIQFAATSPKNLKGLVLCAGFATCPVVGWRKVVTKLLQPVLFHLPLTDFALDHFLLGPDAEESLRAVVRKAVTSVKPSVLSARLRSILNCDARKELRQIDVPIWYIQAQQDLLVGPHSLEEILRENRTVQVETIRGPHLLFQREPRRTAEVIDSLARSVFTASSCR